MSRKKLTADFYEDEFWSPDKNIAKMEPEFMFRLQSLRTKLGFPFEITSGYRTLEYNARVGGSENSLHVQGMAVDITHKKWSGIQKHQFILSALSSGFSLGIYQKHFHIDTRSGVKVVWVGGNVC